MGKIIALSSKKASPQLSRITANSGHEVEIFISCNFK